MMITNITAASTLSITVPKRIATAWARYAESSMNCAKVKRQFGWLVHPTAALLGNGPEELSVS